MPDARIGPEPPLQGRFTFVFTDIEGSTILTRRLEENVGQGEYETLRNDHRKLLVQSATENNGWEAGRAGDGHFFVFERAVDALKTVVAFQRLGPITRQIAGKPESVKVRIGVHTCDAVRSAEQTEINGEKLYEYPGNDTNFAARIGAIGAGRQIIVSDSFVREVWGHDFPGKFRHREREDKPAPHSALPDAPDGPKLSLRCWPSRKLKSYETAGPTHLYEILYNDAAAKRICEPGSRFFPEFYVREVNRYIERPEKQTEVFEALGFDDAGKKDEGSIAVLKAAGGMGKTRLAVACGIRAAGSFADGVFFASLAMLQADAEQGRGDAGFLGTALLTALPAARRKAWGLERPLDQAAPTLDEIIAALVSRDLLLILDNYESLLPDVGRTLVQAFAESRVFLLVTTRVAHNVVGIGNTVELDDGMTEPEARELVVARIHQSHPHWEPKADDETAMAELTRFVHGSPLSLELAAAHVPDLPLKQVVADLQARPLGYGLAAFANRDDTVAFERHRSVIHTLDWSYGLLKEHSRRAFAATGLFVGSFPGEALTATADCSPVVVRTLVSSSLLQTSGDGRYTLHNVTRAYARIRLLGGDVVLHLGDEDEEKETRPGREDAAEIRERFIGWYADFLQQYCQPGTSKLNIADVNVRNTLEQERPCILAAAHEACLIPNASLASSFTKFGIFLQRTGLWKEEQKFYASLKSVFPPGNSTVEAAWLLHESANLMANQGQWNEAIATYRQSLEIERKIGNLQGEAASLHGLANVLDKQGQWNEAIATYRQSGVIYKALGDLQGEAASLHGLANVLNKQGQWNEAIATYRQSGRIYKALGDLQGEAASLHGLANVLDSQGQWNEAIATYRQSLEIKRKIGDLQGEAASLHGLANVLDSQGQWNEAIATYRQSLEIKRKIGDLQGEAASLHGLANVLDKQGQWNEAIATYRQSLEIKRKIGNLQGEAASLHGLANVLDKQGQWNEAIATYRQSLEIERKIGDLQGEAASLHGLANVLDSQGQWNEAIATYRQSLEIERKIGNLQGEAASLHGLANVLDKQGQWNEAIATYRQSGVIYKALGDLQGEAASLHGLANVLNKQGQWNEAIATYRQSLEIERKIGDLQGEAVTLSAIGNTYFAQEKYAEASDQYKLGIERLQALGDIATEAMARSNHAVILAHAGRLKEAITEARASVAVYERTQDANGLQGARHILAQLEAMNGGERG